MYHMHDYKPNQMNFKYANKYCWFFVQQGRVHRSNPISNFRMQNFATLAPNCKNTYCHTYLYHYDKKKFFFNWVKQLGFCDFYLEFCNSYFDYIVVLEVAKLKMEIAKPTSFLSPSQKGHIYEEKVNSHRWCLVSCLFIQYDSSKMIHSIVQQQISTQNIFK